MTTTAVFAELLAVGLEAVAWLLLLVLALFDLSGIAGATGGWEALASVFVLGAAYVLGVIVDRISDSALGTLRKKASRRDSRSIGKLRYRALQTASPLTTFVEYQRSRMRLMRGTTLNLIVAAPVASLFLVTSGADWITVVAVVGLLLIGVAAAWYSYLRIGAAQDSWLELISSEDGFEAQSG